MKYKPGDKFIIEIERCIENCEPPTYRMKNCMFSLSETTLCTLEPYSKEAEYKRGLNDAWEAARKILLLKVSDVGNVFDVPHWSDVFKNYTAEEALERIRAYEASQEIHVGDEVTCEGFGGKAVVTFLNDEDEVATILHWLGGMSYVKKDRLTKTGHHFPEVAALLDKLKGGRAGCMK